MKDSVKSGFVSIVLAVLFAGGPFAGEAQELPSQLRVVLRIPSGVFVTQGESGYEGYDVDLLERFLAWHGTKSGRKVTYDVVLVDSVPDLLEKAQAGECDLAIGSITRTEEREQLVDFSQPYLPIRLVLMAPAERLPNGPYQTALAGRTVGGLEGSTGAARAEELKGEVPNLQTRTDYPTYEEMFGDLLAPDPKIDAVVTDITHFWDLSRTRDVVLVAPMSPQQGLAVVFPKGSTIRPLFDEFLAEFRRSPSYYHLIRRYFGQKAADMVLLAKEE